jgi:hypothetical protein
VNRNSLRKKAFKTTLCGVLRAGNPGNSKETLLEEITTIKIKSPPYKGGLH